MQGLTPGKKRIFVANKLTKIRKNFNILKERLKQDYPEYVENVIFTECLNEPEGYSSFITGSCDLDIKNSFDFEKKKPLQSIKDLYIGGKKKSITRKKKINKRLKKKSIKKNKNIKNIMI